MSEPSQEDQTTKKSAKVKHSFKKAFTRHALTSSSGSGSNLASPSSSGPGTPAFNPASVLLNDLINTLTSLYMNIKKQ